MNVMFEFLGVPKSKEPQHPTRPRCCGLGDSSFDCLIQENIEFLIYPYVDMVKHRLLVINIYSNRVLKLISRGFMSTAFFQKR